MRREPVAPCERVPEDERGRLLPRPVGGYLALALASLVAAGCGGTGGTFSVGSGDTVLPRSESRAAERAADGDAPRGRVRPGRISETDPLVVTRETFAGTTRPAPADKRAAASAPRKKEAALRSAAGGGDRPSPAVALSGAEASPSATRAMAEGQGESDRGSRKKPGVSGSVAIDAAVNAAINDEGTGGIGAWILGLLLAGAVTGGGWLALQPGPVRRRVLRGILAAPGRLLARIRGASAHGTTTTTTWSTPSSAWTTFAGSGDAGAEESRTEGVAPRRRPERHRRGITNATLPAMRIPIEKDFDAPPADED